MQTIAILAEQILPTDKQLLALAGFILLIVICNITFFLGLKLQLGSRRRLGIWMAWISAIVLAGLILFIVTHR